MGEIAVERSLEVAAPAPAIWEEMMKVESWPEWKPFVQKAKIASGYEALSCGSKIKMRLMIGGPAALPLSVTVTEFNRPERLAWEAGVKGLLYGEHSFSFKSMGKTTRVTSQEVFKGPLTALLKLMITREDLERLHMQWLEAIKQRMERQGKE